MPADAADADVPRIASQRPRWLAEPPGTYNSRRPAIAAEPDRIITTQEAAAFCGFSVSHWRVMFRTGQAPPPIKLSERKYGWKLSTLRAWIDAKATAAA